MRSEIERDHALPDGTIVHIREIRSDDRQRMKDMWSRTSAESRRARFHGHFELTDKNIGQFTDLDPERQLAVVATLGRGEHERIVGVARYERLPEEHTAAEFAALVEDEQQGRGIGTALVRVLAQTAAAEGIKHLTGEILADNSRMLRVVRDVGLKTQSTREPIGAGSVVHTDMSLEITEEFLRVVDDSERDAARAALNRFFRPERIAVVGASRDRQAIGGLVFDNLLKGDVHATVYPVNRGAESVQGVAAYPSLSDCPNVPDLVIVSVPAAAVNEVVDEAGSLGVRAVCVVSAGFSEAGPSGRDRQHQLTDIASSYGMRIVGPNCMGLMNASAQHRMNGTFSQTFPQPGVLGFSSQSGALGLAVLEHVTELGLGISTFVSVGNKADISGNDLLLYWEDDPDTEVLLLYLESFGNPRKFSRIARRVSRSKPIVAVKSGRTSAGVRAASSHTAAISSGDVAVDALFRQTGVIRTDTLEELFDVATLLASQPLPKGNRVAILTNAGGPGILAADACESHGLAVPSLSEDTQAKLAEFLPAEAGIKNPVDMIASATADGYGHALEIMANAHEVDAVFVIFVPAGMADTTEVAQALVDAKVPEDVPVVSVFMRSRGIPEPLHEASIPSFRFPEDAARALGRVAGYADWRSRPLGVVVRPESVDTERAQRIVRSALSSTVHSDNGKRMIGKPHTAAATGSESSRRGHSTWLSSAEAEAVLDAYGVPLARSRVVSSPDEAAETQREFGTEVAVKVAAPIHKTDVGGIRLSLDTPEAAAEAVTELKASLEQADMAEHASSFLVQEMVTGGVEMAVGVTHDPSFGPLIMAGMGGTLVELIKDVSVRVTPLTDRDVDEMLSSLRMKPLLTGYRGSPPVDVDALKDLLYRINAMVEDLPEITELDLNPVFVREDGVVSVDVRMKVTEAV